MAQKSDEKNYNKEMYEFYRSFETGITDERMLTAVHMRKKNQEDEKALQFCIASYICSDEDIRGFLEEELGKDDLVIKNAKDILNGAGKELSETQKEAKKQPKNGHFTEKENKRNQNSPGLSIIN